MDDYVIFVTWRSPEANKYQAQRVRLLKIYEDGERVEIVVNRQFMTVPKSEVELSSIG